MKRLISVLLVVAILATSCVALVGCGKEEEGDSVYTLNYAMSVFPTNWNPHTYETNTDAEILDYIVAGFYHFDYNDTLDGYKVVPYMATSEPVDVTDQYVGQYGIKDGDTAKAYTISLRDDIKWEDGTVINAQSFVNSAKLLLDPTAQNYRADSLYSGNMVIANSQDYLYQGQTINLENAANAFYTMDDLTLGDDGQYVTPNGEPVYLAVDFALNEWLNGYTLNEYVAAYGDTYFDTTNWDTLLGMMDDDGLVPLTDETYALYAPVTTGNPAWGESEEDLPAYFAYASTYPEMDFSEVGLIATDEYELTIVLSKPLSGFYLLYSLTDSWLVNEELYNSLATVEDGVYTNTYGTSVDTTMSYGPYKLTEFQSDKTFAFEKNEYFFAFNDEENKDLYQTTNIKYDYVPEAPTRLEMFLNGELDSYTLQADDMETYSKSDYCYYTTGDSTFFMAVNPDLEALTAMQENAGENINKTIITIKEFRMALSFALDRAAFCLAVSPTNNAAFAAYSSYIISNPEEGTAYRTTDQAKQVVADFWGLSEDIGAGKTYANIDEAISSVTGYNLEKAKELFNEAYAIAVEQGLMDEDDVIEICIGLPSASSNFYNNGYEFLVNNYTDAVKGTDLEGKLTFTKDDTVGNGFADALKANNVDMLFAVGWTGSALDPYGLMEAYTSSSYQYDPAWDTTAEKLVINVNDKDYVASVWDWTKAMSGEVIVIREVDANGEVVSGSDVEFSAGDSDGIPETRLDILAALEGAILATYDMIPMMDDSSASLKGAKYNYYTEDYIYGVGRGGVKYLTFNYNDAEWAEYVASQGGTLNYK